MTGIDICIAMRNWLIEKSDEAEKNTMLYKDAEIFDAMESGKKLGEWEAYLCMRKKLQELMGVVK